MVMKSFQQAISKTIWANVEPCDLVCLYGMISRLPDRPNMTLTMLTGP